MSEVAASEQSKLMPGWSRPEGFDPDIHQLAFSQLRMVEEFFIGLNPDSRCRRFGSLMSDGALSLHAIRALQDASLVLGIFSSHKLCGVLELYERGGSDVMELLLVVDGRSHRRGMGWRLIDASLRQAACLDTRSVEMIFARNNWPMRRIAQKARATIDLMFDTYCAQVDPKRYRVVATTSPGDWQRSELQLSAM